MALWGNSIFHAKVLILLSVLLLLQNVAADVLLYTYFSKCTFFKANFSSVLGGVRCFHLTGPNTPALVGLRAYCGGFPG